MPCYHTYTPLHLLPFPACTFCEGPISRNMKSKYKLPDREEVPGLSANSVRSSQNKRSDAGAPTRPRDTGISAVTSLKNLFNCHYISKISELSQSVGG